MVQLIGIVLVIVVVVVGLWVLTGGAERAAGEPAVRWLVQLEDGRALRFEGEFPPPGWRSVQEIALAQRITGIIRFRGPGMVEFSDEIGEADRQRLRNVLAQGPGSGCIPGPKG
jgi:hypothetical protein